MEILVNFGRFSTEFSPCGWKRKTSRKRIFSTRAAKGKKEGDGTGTKEPEVVDERLGEALEASPVD